MSRPLVRVLVVVFVILIGAMAAADWSAAGQGSPGQDTEATLKLKVAQATRRLAREGIIASSGHVSARIPGTDRILIGPGYVTRDILSPDDIVTVDLNTKQIAGKHERPGETDIHTG